MRDYIDGPTPDDLTFKNWCALRRYRSRAASHFVYATFLLTIPTIIGGVALAVIGFVDWDWPRFLVVFGWMPVIGLFCAWRAWHWHRKEQIGQVVARMGLDVEETHEAS